MSDSRISRLDYFINWKVSTDDVFTIFVGFLVLFISCYFIPLYHSGDQFHYTQYYNDIKNLSLIEAYNLQRQNLSAAEPLHAVLAWLLSGVIHKTLFSSLLNSMLALVMVKYFLRLKISKSFILFFVLFNYYLLVLYFSAERFKLGMLFLVAAVNYYYLSKNIRSSLFLFLAFLSHFQIILLLIPFLMIKLLEFTNRMIIYQSFSLLRFIYILLFLVFSIFVYVFFNEYIYAKVMFYSLGQTGFYEILKPGMFMLLCLLVLNNRFKIIFAFMPILVSAFVLSSDRITMLAYILFLHLSLKELSYSFFGARFSVGNIYISSTILINWVVLLYLFYKSILYINNIIQFGNGFP